jgi:hypothetical protein
VLWLKHGMGTPPPELRQFLLEAAFWEFLGWTRWDMARVPRGELRQYSEFISVIQQLRANETRRAQGGSSTPQP